MSTVEEIIVSIRQKHTGSSVSFQQIKCTKVIPAKQIPFILYNLLLGINLGITDLHQEVHHYEEMPLQDEII